MSRRQATRRSNRVAIPRGGVDFIYGRCIPHETEQDQLVGIEFDRDCLSAGGRLAHGASRKRRALGLSGE